MLSSFALSVELDGGRTSDYPYSVFNYEYVGVVGNQTSLLRPSWISHQHGGEYMRLISIGSLVVDVIGHYIDVTYIPPCSTSCLSVCKD